VAKLVIIVIKVTSKLWKDVATLNRKKNKTRQMTRDRNGKRLSITTSGVWWRKDLAAIGIIRPPSRSIGHVRIRNLKAENIRPRRLANLDGNELPPHRRRVLLLPHHLRLLFHPYHLNARKEKRINTNGRDLRRPMGSERSARPSRRSGPKREATTNHQRKKRRKRGRRRKRSKTNTRIRNLTQLRKGKEVANWGRWGLILMQLAVMILKYPVKLFSHRVTRLSLAFILAQVVPVNPWLKKRNERPNPKIL
jgi:hypothetical protein